MDKFNGLLNDKSRKKRKRIDRIYSMLTYLAACVGVLIFGSILGFVFVNGSKLISFDLVFGDYYATEYHVSVINDGIDKYTEPLFLSDGEMYSSLWGVAIGVSEDINGEEQIVFTYIDEFSPLRLTTDLYDNSEIEIKEGVKINRISFTDGLIVIPKYGVEKIISSFENSYAIDELYVSSEGGGIRGSLITTLYLMFFTLLIALPVGIFTAIYLNEYAKDNYFNRQLRQFIEMLTGVPSIIFGLIGLVVFIPLTSSFGFSGRNVIAGALTMAVIILPTIIRTTEESLKVIPNDLRHASLALGANYTQTTFKVILPNALPGILTATILGIGRIVGESAALIFVMGTIINDSVTLDSSSTTLAVQIWSVMGGEVANFELASAISIIILIVVLVLNLIVKYITYRLNKTWH
ncbi:MAG: phosphate ABC transporter permease PstA [Candidatus Izemoplasma sp.]